VKAARQQYAQRRSIQNAGESWNENENPINAVSAATHNLQQAQVVVKGGGEQERETRQWQRTVLCNERNGRLRRGRTDLI